MATVTPNILLTSWNLATDSFSHDDLADNWSLLDNHDHSENKGVQIPEGGIANDAISQTKLADNSVGTDQLIDDQVTENKVLSSANHLNKPIERVSGKNVSANNNTTTPYFFTQDADTLHLSGAAANSKVVPVVWINPNDYLIPGVSTKLQVEVYAAVNSVAPAMTTTVGLYPVTVAGAAGNIVYTAGTLVPDSTVALVSPTASQFVSVSGVDANPIRSAEIDLPAAGYYALAFRNSATPTANSILALTARLYYKHLTS